MSRRTAAGVADRHALLSGQSYPAAVSSRAPNAQYMPYRSDSPFENPYARSASDMVGAPKKELYGSDAQQRAAADIEEQNDMRLEGLSDRIRLLKDVRWLLTDLNWHWC